MLLKGEKKTREPLQHVLSPLCPIGVPLESCRGRGHVPYCCHSLLSFSSTAEWRSRQHHSVGWEEAAVPSFHTHTRSHTHRAQHPGPLNLSGCSGSFPVLTGAEGRDTVCVRAHHQVYRGASQVLRSTAPGFSMWRVPQSVWEAGEWSHSPVASNQCAAGAFNWCCSGLYNETGLKVDMDSL